MGGSGIGVVGSKQQSGSHPLVHTLHMSSSVGADVRAVCLLASFSEKPREIKVGLGRDLSSKRLAAQA